MEIRPLHMEDMDASFDLSAYAFQYELSPEQREMRRKEAAPEDTLGCFVDGQLAAKLTVLPLRIYMYGESVAMGGVAGVATWPEHRRGGMVDKLLRIALSQMKECGQIVSMLSPFSVPFYRKYGWELYTDAKKYTIANDRFPKLADVSGRLEEVRGNWELLSGLYGRWAARYNGMLDRDIGWWENRLMGGFFPRRPGRALVYRDVSGAAQGYVLTQIKDKVLKVHELVALTEEARLGIWKLLANHDSMAERMEMTVPADDDQMHWLPEPRVETSVTPYFMARIVDLEPFLGHCRYRPAAGAESVRIAVSDEHAPWNAGIYRLDWSAGGELRVAKEADGGSPLPDTDVPAVRSSIGALAAMLLGYRRPAALARYRAIRGEPEAVDMLERRLIPAPTGMMDYF